MILLCIVRCGSCGLMMGWHLTWWCHIYSRNYDWEFSPLKQWNDSNRKETHSGRIGFWMETWTCSNYNSEDEYLKFIENLLQILQHLKIYLNLNTNKRVPLLNIGYDSNESPILKDEFCYLVNIDHIAVLWEARKINDPNPPWCPLVFVNFALIKSLFT